MRCLDVKNSNQFVEEMALATNSTYVEPCTIDGLAFEEINDFLDGYFDDEERWIIIKLGPLRYMLLDMLT